MSEDKRRLKKKSSMILGPKSYKQRLFPTDNETDIILYGGGRISASTLKTLS